MPPDNNGERARTSSDAVGGCQDNIRPNQASSTEMSYSIFQRDSVAEPPFRRLSATDYPQALVELVSLRLVYNVSGISFRRLLHVQSLGENATRFIGEEFSLIGAADRRGRRGGLRRKHRRQKQSRALHLLVCQSRNQQQVFEFYALEAFEDLSAVGIR